MNRQIRILLIDDDEVDRALVKRALKGTPINYTLCECMEGGQAVDILKSGKFDCVFLDYLLPGTDGLMLLKKLRREGISTPIVIITSQGDEKIAVDMMKAGATDYVIKTQLTSHNIGQILRNAIRLQEVEAQREKTAMALKVSEARLAEAQRIAKLGNWEYDCVAKSIYWSAEVYRIFNRDPKLFTPTIDSFYECYHKDDIGLIKKTIKNALEGKPFNVDFRINDGDKLQRFGNTQGHTVFDENNNPMKIIGTVQDVTDRKQVEQELIKAKQLTEETSRAKEQFLANMSHEIRTPMNAIIGFARLLMKEDFSAEHKKYIEAIYNSGENLLVIINDILDFSKITSGKMIFEESRFSLSQMVKTVIELFLPKAEEKNIILNHSIEEDVPLNLIGDSVRLTQVLTNLLSNALKFTAKGHVDLHIQALEEEEGFVALRFSVADTGIGIAEDKVEAIFESFTQASSSTTREFGGTGLGLSIVKSIVELLGGNIKVFSRVGQGSTFVIELKCQKSNFSTDAVPEHSIDTKGANNLSCSLNGVRVLVAEDNALNKLLTKVVLEKAGCIVEVAENGLIVLEKLRGNSFDIILMDIQMPEMDGYEATKAIRSQCTSPLSEIPIMAMTAHALSSEVNKCMSLGMNDYISKPFEAKKLYRKIAKLVINESTRAEEDSNDGRKTCEDGLYLSESRGNQEPHTIPAQDRVPVEKLVDFESVLSYTEGDPDFLAEMINIFLEESPKNMRSLRKFHEKQDWNNLRLLAHKCKSSFGTMGVKQMHVLMKTIEDACKKEKVAKEEINELTNRAIILNAKVVNEFSEELKKLEKIS